MDFTDFRAGADDEGKRLDKITRVLLPPQTGCFEAIRKRLVRLNGKKTAPDVRVKDGDVINIASFLLSSEVPETTACPTIHFEDCFRNEHIRIIYKPRGINVQNAVAGEMSIASAIKQEAQAQGMQSLSFCPAPLHRLDANTTGLLAVSQSAEGARWFTEAIKIHGIAKTYVAVAKGRIPSKTTWTDLLQDSPVEARTFHTVRVVTGPSSGARKAVTTVIPLATGNCRGQPVTLAEYQIETGRKHQIRAQSSFHGFPLFGDSAYGGGSAISDAAPFFLHAVRMGFPADNPLELPPYVTADIPSDFDKFLNSVLIKWNIDRII